MTKGKIAASIIALVLIFDQVVKIWIKTSLPLGGEIRITDWFILHFTENNGMAFGLEFAGVAGKYFLTVFRIIAASAIMYYIVKLVKNDAPLGLIVCMALIFAGATGNIFDSMFYGLIFNESYYQVADLFPKAGGYAPLLQGRVVDMLYFPLLKGQYPGWIPFLGGDDFLFFRPVFNIADSSITIGIFSLLLFNRKHLNNADGKSVEGEAEKS